MNSKEFSKGVERLINPIDVGTLHFMQFFNRMLPKFIQDKLVTSAAKETPYMGFVVEPYAYFLCYEISDIERAKSLLPDNFELVKTKILDNDEPKYYCIFGCFTAHTSAFWGSRIEFYIIAENKETGMLSWIIVDYDSNTISHDVKYGLRSPNSSKAVVTTNHDGRIFVDVQRDDVSRKLQLEGDVTSQQWSKLDQRLWLEGNLSIGYSRELGQGNAHIFSLKFDPQEVEKALVIPLNSVRIEANTWYPGLFNNKPSQVVCFPYAQHFISDSPGASSTIRNEQELERAIKTIDFSKIKVFSTKAFKTMSLVGMGASLLLTLTLVFLLLTK